MAILNLDKFELLYYIEGCARGSHLRQGIWEDVVNKIIPQLDDNEMDCLWWWCRRDLWDVYMKGTFDRYAYNFDDYLKGLAALHRGNYAKIKVVGRVNGRRKQETVMAYQFDGHWWLEGSFTKRIPEEYIKKLDKVELMDNEAVEYKHLDWWRDLGVYTKEYIEKCWEDYRNE